MSQTAEPALVDALAGRQQMHAQRAAQPPDRHEQLGEVEMLTEQFGVLIDHDEQRWQRRKGATVRARIARSPRCL